MRRVIQRMIEDPLSETLLTTKFSAGDSVMVEMVDGVLRLTPIKKEREVKAEPKAEKPEKPEKPPKEPVAGKGKGES